MFFSFLLFTSLFLCSNFWDLLNFYPTPSCYFFDNHLISMYSFSFFASQSCFIHVKPLICIKIFIMGIFFCIVPVSSEVHFSVTFDFLSFMLEVFFNGLMILCCPFIFKTKALKKIIGSFHREGRGSEESSLPTQNLLYRYLNGAPVILLEDS